MAAVISSFRKLPIVLIVGALTFIHTANADQYASEARSVAAKGHYARARALLVEALAHFDYARSKEKHLAAILDSDEWRLSVISRAEELNRLLDPLPNVNRDGTRFRAEQGTIRKERSQSKSLADVIEQTRIERAKLNDTTSDQLIEELSNSILKEEVTERPEKNVIRVPGTTETIELGAKEKAAEELDPAAKAALATAPDSVVLGEDKPEDADSIAKSLGLVEVEEEGEVIAENIDEEAKLKLEKELKEKSNFPPSEEDQLVAEAIEQAIKERLEKLGAKQ